MNLRGPAAINAEKQMCVRGHAFSKENTGLAQSAYGHSMRYCKHCRRERARQLRREVTSVLASDDFASLLTDMVRQQLESNFVKSDACWVWRGRPDDEGYGKFLLRGVRVRAHRISFLLYRGAIPDGKILDHTCRNRLCVNPDHLDPVTDAVNILRGGGVAAVNAKRIVCKHGHALSPENTRIYTKPDGYVMRQCRTCQRDYQQGYQREYRSGVRRRGKKAS